MKARVSAIRELVKECVREVLNEENELLKAQDSIKGSIFKVTKALDPLLKKWKDEGFIKSYKTRVSPYNNGYEAKFNVDADYNKYVELDKMTDKKAKARIEKIANFISNNFMGSGIYLYPDAFFQDHVDEGTKTRMTGRKLYFDKKGQFPHSADYTVSKGDDIKKGLKKYTDENLAAIKKWMAY